jgi:hypothetical protein
MQLLNATRQELKGERARAASLQLRVQALQAAASLSSSAVLAGQPSHSSPPTPRALLHPSAATSLYSSRAPVGRTSRPCTPAHPSSHKRPPAAPGGSLSPRAACSTSGFEAGPSEPSARQPVSVVAVPVGFSYNPGAAMVPTAPVGLPPRPATQRLPAVRMHEEQPRPASVPLGTQRPQLDRSCSEAAFGEHMRGSPSSVSEGRLAVTLQERSRVGHRVGNTFGSPASAGMLNLLEGAPPCTSARRPRSRRSGVADNEITRLSSGSSFSTRGGVSRHVSRPRTISAGCHVSSEGGPRAGAGRLLRSESWEAVKAPGVRGDVVASGGSGAASSVSAVSRRQAAGTARKAAGGPPARGGSAAMPTRQARPPPAQTGLTRGLLPSHEASLG